MPGRQTPQQISGSSTELSAEKMLSSHGLVLIERNFQCRFGEIDLIMLDELHLVFIEVRLRSRSQFGNGLESITRSKQQKIIRAAHIYLQHNPRFQQHLCRFDVVSGNGASAESTDLVWIKDAFQTTG